MEYTYDVRWRLTPCLFIIWMQHGRQTKTMHINEVLFTHIGNTAAYQDASFYSVIHTKIYSATLKFTVRNTVYCSVYYTEHYTVVMSFPVHRRAIT